MDSIISGSIYILSILVPTKVYMFVWMLLSVCPPLFLYLFAVLIAVIKSALAMKCSPLNWPFFSLHQERITESQKVKKI